MKPLAEMTEADLMQASDVELNRLLADHLSLVSPKEQWDKCGDRVKNTIAEVRDWSSTGNGMLEVLEAMKKEWEIEITLAPEELPGCWLKHRSLRLPEIYIEHASLPRAVAVAALLAVKERGQSPAP